MKRKYIFFVLFFGVYLSLSGCKTQDANMETRANSASSASNQVIFQNTDDDTPMEKYQLAVKKAKAKAASVEAAYINATVKKEPTNQKMTASDSLTIMEEKSVLVATGVVTAKKPEGLLGTAVSTKLSFYINEVYQGHSKLVGKTITYGQDGGLIKAAKFDIKSKAEGNINVVYAGSTLPKVGDELFLCLKSDGLNQNTHATYQLTDGQESLFTYNAQTDTYSRSTIGANHEVTDKDTAAAVTKLVQGG